MAVILPVELQGSETIFERLSTFDKRLSINKKNLPSANFGIFQSSRDSVFYLSFSSKMLTISGSWSAYSSESCFISPLSFFWHFLWMKSMKYFKIFN